MDSTRKILLLGASYGGMHMYAAEAVKDYYERHYPADVHVESIDFLEKFTPGLGVLAKFAYQQPEPFFPSSFSTLGDLERNMPANPVVHELKQTGCAGAADYIDRFEPDAVIATFPVAGGVAAELARDRRFLSAIVITDFDVKGAWLHPGTDAYFVATKEAREDLVVRGVPWDRIVVTGVPIRESFVERAEQAESRRQFGLSERFTVLITSQPANPGDIGDLARSIASIGVQTVVLAGKSERVRRHLDGLAEETELLRVFGFVEDMPRMMRSADLVVGRVGALTTLEAFALGVPLVICGNLSGQESANVDFIVNCGAGLAARDEGDVTEKVRFLATHSERLAQLSCAAAGLGRPASAQAVCERVISALR